MLEEVMNDKSYVPMKAKELAMLLGIPKSQRDELTQVLDYLCLLYTSDAADEL